MAGNRQVGGGLLDPKMLWTSTPTAFRKLDPRSLWKNPVMFIVEIGSVWTTWLAIREHTTFAIVTTVWLWLTVLFANLAEAVAEGRGKAQAESLRKTRTETEARRLAGADSLDVEVVPHQPEDWRHRSCFRRRDHSVRRRGDRGRRVGERGGDHRRIRTGRA